MFDLSAAGVPHLPLPLVYAGLGGSLLALIVATAQQNWSLRVFFLLALRLGIGWHFAFEGLHKINSHLVGPTDTNRPVTSEPYFAVAEGPFGDYMRRKYLGDPAATVRTHLTPKEEVTPERFAALPEAEQAARCPDAAAAELDRQIGEPDKATAAKASFARWVYGVDPQPAKVKFVGSGDVQQTAPDRLRQIEVMRKWVKELHDREALGLGVGYGIEQKRASQARSELRAAETELAGDTDAFLTRLAAQYTDKPADPAEKAVKPAKPIAAMDKLTMWTLTIAGLGVFFGLFTPVACLVCAGFLVLTYLTHPAVPWHPLPPNTEGNPLFVNKNVIECIALLTVAVHPTGRWLGLDAIWTRLVLGK
jgi:uncharacterized membrane protein YphA (DoxX/SURF4 family)